MTRGNETNMHHRPERARQSESRCDVLPHAEKARSLSTRAEPLRRFVVGCGVIVAVAIAAGCSGDDKGTTGSGGAGGAGGSAGTGGSAPHDAGDMDGFVICPVPGDPIDTYHANLVKNGSEGVLSFTLVQSDNVPPSRGDNTWQLKITKKDQTSITGEVVPEVKMPRHMHPPSKPPEITFDAAKGIYTVAPVYFFMPGYWSAQFVAYERGSDAEAPLDRGTFYFCVE
jgi:YtkA-like